MAQPTAAVDYRTLSPARTLTGASGDALQNRNPDPLPDGALCFVIDERSLYRLAKFSTTAISSPTVVATARGAGVAGRWVLYALGTGPTGATGAAGP